MEIRRIVLLFLIYLITAKFGLSLNAVSGFAALVWLPSGISLAALLLFGSKLWPGIFLGAFLANYLSGASLLSATGISIGNTLEALMGMFLLKNIFDFRNTLERVKDVLGLSIAAAILSTLISATIGVLSLWLGGNLADRAVLQTWTFWWIGDMVSILIITPLILVWSHKPNLNVNSRRLLEALNIVLVSLLIYLIIFRDFLGFLTSDKPLAYMVFPPLIWASLRFGQLGAVTALFALSVLTIISTFEGYGPFSTGVVTEDLLSLQTFMAVTSVTTMILATVISERDQVEKNKNEFISVAAHELKTPLTTLKGYTQLLQLHLKKTADQKGLKLAFKMITPIDNLTRLITDFFEVTKIQTGKFELQKETFEIDGLLKEVVMDINHLTSTHKISIAGATNNQVLADRFRISQVITNLLYNAIKFSPESEAVEVNLSTTDSFIKVQVKDSGIGISKKDLPSVFDRFFQAKTQIRPSNAGLGLGLFISEEIIRRHGGRIWVESLKGKGSTFSFTLPVQNSGGNYH